MTIPARITQADMARAAKSVRAAGYERARIVMDLANAKIEIIIGESAAKLLIAEEWDDEDV
jgi:hypothetical protein